MSLLRKVPAAKGGVTEEFLRLRPQEAGQVAVLPPTNETTDMDLPPLVRTTVADGLAARGFSVLDAETVDERLARQGVSQAGQLGHMSARSVGELVGAEHLLYSNIEEYTRAIVWTKGHCRRFFSSYRLVHAPSGKTLWLASSDANEPMLFGTQTGLIRRGVREALGTLSGGNVLTERDLQQPLHRERLRKVIWQMYGGGRLPDSGFYAGTLIRTGKGPTHFEAGYTYGRSAQGDDRTASALDLGACRWFPINAFINAYASAGLSLGGRTVEKASGTKESFLLMPYAGVGVGFHLMGALSSLEFKVSEASGGFGFGLTMGYIF
jgi:hypothetical protein